MLELKALTKHFGGVKAVDGLDLDVREGEIFGLIGPNGSGKSTTVNLICGVFPATSGTVLFRDKDITAAQPHQALAEGVARTFQNIRLFGESTVWQNLWVAQNAREDRKTQNIIEQLLSGPRVGRRLAPLLDKAGTRPIVKGLNSLMSFVRRWFFGSRAARRSVEELLEFAGLSEKRDELAGNLAFGEQRRLELARALAAKPKLLLLDEPAAGMNMEEVGQLDERLRALQKAGITILLVEHVMELVMGVTDRIAVLNFGKKIAEGTPSEIQQNADVREAYLGASGRAGKRSGTG